MALRKFDHNKYSVSRSSASIYLMLLICSPLVRHIKRFGKLQQDGIKQCEGGISNGSATELAEAVTAVRPTNVVDSCENAR